MVLSEFDYGLVGQCHGDGMVCGGTDTTDWASNEQTMFVQTGDDTYYQGTAHGREMLRKIMERYREKHTWEGNTGEGTYGGLREKDKENHT